MTLVLRYAARSDVGLVRSNNEDSVYAGARLLALADGMGGHAAGEVASQLVIAALAHLDDDEPGGDLLAKLDAAVHSGNSAIAAQVEMEPDLDGMGTTLTAILFAGNRIGMIHIGDSRGYLLRDGELTQITKDDTFVQTLVDDGLGSLQRAYEALKRQLSDEGLFAPERKKPIPLMPATVGFITSAAGAAVQDFMRILIRRGWRGRAVVLPARVQGEGAAAEMAALLALAERLGIFDLLVIGRGGGSAEDLWAFCAAALRP